MTDLSNKNDEALNLVVSLVLFKNLQTSTHFLLIWMGTKRKESYSNDTIPTSFISSYQHKTKSIKNKKNKTKQTITCIGYRADNPDEIANNSLKRKRKKQINYVSPDTHKRWNNVIRDIFLFNSLLVALYSNIDECY